MAADILTVARQLGAQLKKVAPNEWAGPCLHCGTGRDRFSVNTQRQVWHCRICLEGGRAVKLVCRVRGWTYPDQLPDALRFLADECGDDEARDRLADFEERHKGKASAAPEQRQKLRLQPRPQAPLPEPVKDNRPGAIKLWRSRQPIAGSLAEHYLRKTRCYTGIIPATLGFLPGSEKYEPAMIAAYGVAQEPEPGLLAIHDSDVHAVHLTSLTATGERIRKITYGRGAAGSPIVVAPPNDLLGLAITEGLEDALSVHLATGLGAWAAGSAPFMPALAETVPNYIEHVTILADDNEAGQTNSFALAQRIEARGIATTIITLEADRG